MLAVLTLLCSEEFVDCLVQPQGNRGYQNVTPVLSGFVVGSREGTLLRALIFTCPISDKIACVL